MPKRTASSHRCDGCATVGLLPAPSSFTIAGDPIFARQYTCRQDRFVWIPAVPGFKPPVKALCVVPQGMQEGTELVIAGREFGLLTGHPAEFRFYSSAVRSGDRPGEILPDAERDLEETSLLEMNLPPLADFPAGQVVPVQINSVVTELGMLELWMKHVNSDRRWKVEFQVRTE
jgi:hypothetical protein